MCFVANSFLVVPRVWDAHTLTQHRLSRTKGCLLQGQLVTAYIHTLELKPVCNRVPERSRGRALCSRTIASRSLLHLWVFPCGLPFLHLAPPSSRSLSSHLCCLFLEPQFLSPCPLRLSHHRSGLSKPDQVTMSYLSHWLPHRKTGPGSH